MKDVVSEIKKLIDDIDHSIARGDASEPNARYIRNRLAEIIGVR